MKYIRSLLLLTLAVAGCKHGHSLVGDWTTNAPNSPQKVHFAQDGTWSGTMDKAVGSLNIHADINGTYAASGNQLTLKISSLKLTGVPPAFQSVVSAQEKQAQGQTQNGTIQWNTDDQFVFSGTAKGPNNKAQGIQATFDRLKS